MPEKVTSEDLKLLGQLGVDTKPKKKAAHTAREQRIIAGYEEIERFVEKHGRLPAHGEHRDIFERLYAVRLDQLRRSAECRTLLQDIDKKRLLDIQEDYEDSAVEEVELGDVELLQALGVDKETNGDITQLKFVRSSEEKLAAEEVARRTPCPDFGIFKPLFQQVQQDLETGFRKTLKFQDNAEINKGELFILEGQKVYVAEWGEKFINHYDRPDRRLRVIYDNGMESNLLMRSLQRALNKDEASRRITDPNLGPLFSDQESENDQEVGHIYVLRSKSENPFIIENRTVIHKIEVTRGSVKRRIANAAKDPTYLLTEVEVVETYKLANIDPVKLEKLLHRFFSKARLDLKLKDRFGQGVEPREWFIVPLQEIQKAIRLLKQGTIGDYHYEPTKGRILKN